MLCLNQPVLSARLGGFLQYRAAGRLCDAACATLPESTCAERKPGHFPADWAAGRLREEACAMLCLNQFVLR